MFEGFDSGPWSDETDENEPPPPWYIQIMMLAMVVVIIRAVYEGFKCL
jgi:hypothetical protein